MRKGMKIPHVEAGNIVPTMAKQGLPENVSEKEAGNAPKSTLLENIPKAKEEMIGKILDSLKLQGIESCSEQQQHSAKSLIREYQHLFALTLNELGKTSLVQHNIILDDETPFKERYQRIPPHQYEEVRKHFQEMLNIGAIQWSTSPWACSVVLDHMKDSFLWFCIDLRKLNKQTIKDAQNLPRIEDSLDCLDGATIFTSLDLQSGYWQVELTEASRPLTAFTIGPLGFYECVQMPFGLTNAPATFPCLMKSCLGEMHLKWCIIYPDDIIVFSKTPEEDIERLRGVFKKLSAAGLWLKPRKCEFFKSRITYQGHTVSKNGIETEKKEVIAIQEWLVPKTVTEVCSLLGFMNYYCKFIPKYAQITQPIYQMVSGENANRKKTLVKWSGECPEAFSKLKQLC